jgi:hypothetical protein
MMRESPSFASTSVAYPIPSLLSVDEDDDDDDDLHTCESTPTSSPTHHHHRTMAGNEEVIEEGKSRSSIFLQAMTPFTICITGSSSRHPSKAVDATTTTAATPRASCGGILEAADRETQKALGHLARQMTVTRAITEDAQVLSALLDRLFS